MDFEEMHKAFERALDYSTCLSVLLPPAPPRLTPLGETPDHGLVRAHQTDEFACGNLLERHVDAKND